MTNPDAGLLTLRSISIYARRESGDYTTIVKKVSGFAPVVCDVVGLVRDELERCELTDLIVRGGIYSALRSTLREVMDAYARQSLDNKIRK